MTKVKLCVFVLIEANPLPKKDVIRVFLKKMLPPANDLRG